MDQPPALQRWLATRREAVRASTVNIDIKALRAYFRWLEVIGSDEWRPLVLPKQRKMPTRTVRALSDAEVGLLLAAPDLTAFVGLRDHVIIATL